MNKTIELINESQVNLLKNAGLSDISFECLLPNVRYPFARYMDGFHDAMYYMDEIEYLKKSQQPFQFIVSRKMPSGQRLSYTNMTVSLEDYETKESADNGFDITVSINLKQYRHYGTRIAKLPSSIYVVKEGDTLWNIAKKTNSDYDQIKNANKKALEGTLGGTKLTAGSKLNVFPWAKDAKSMLEYANARNPYSFKNADSKNENTDNPSPTPGPAPGETSTGNVSGGLVPGTKPK